MNNNFQSDFFEIFSEIRLDKINCTAESPALDSLNWSNQRDDSTAFIKKLPNDIKMN